MIKIFIYFFMTCILIVGLSYNQYTNNKSHYEFFIDNPPEFVLSMTNNQTERDNYILESQYIEYAYKFKNPELKAQLIRSLILALISLIVILFMWRDIPSIKDNEWDKLPFFMAMYLMIVMPFIDALDELKSLYSDIRTEKSPAFRGVQKSKISDNKGVAVTGL